MLEMSVEEQEERIRARHEGSQHAVDIMRVGGYSQCDIKIIVMNFFLGLLLLAQP